MKTLIHLGDHPVVLIQKDFDSEVDLDKITSIDYSNLYGEQVTVSALLNKVGSLRALAERALSETKLKHDIQEAKFKKDLREEARNNSGVFEIDGTVIKLTEKALDEAPYHCDTLNKMKREIIECKKDYEVLDSLFWAVQAKCSKLNNIIRPVTPEELFKELIEGKINGITIVKGKM